MKKALKLVYNRLPFKQPLFNMVKRLWQPPDHVYRHLYFKGLFTVAVSKTEQFRIQHYGYELENELFWKGIAGGWEKVSIGLWTRLCRQASVIVDIGANTGVYSLVAKSVNPRARVFAFEPVARVFEKLEENNRLNNYDIVCLRKAVSNYTGKAVIYDTNEEHIYSVTVNKNLHDATTTVRQSEIETVSLREFIEKEHLTHIDLMKIDVETHEPEVLEGLGAYLEKFRPTMFVEVLNDEVGSRINELVKDLEYLYFNIDEDRGIRQENRIGHSDYFNFLLCTKQVAYDLGLLTASSAD